MLDDGLDAGRGVPVWDEHGDLPKLLVLQLLDLALQGGMGPNVLER